MNSSSTKHAEVWGNLAKLTYSLCFSCVLLADKLTTGSQKQVEAMARKWADLYDSDPSTARGQLLHLLLQVWPSWLFTAADLVALQSTQQPPSCSKILQFSTAL